MYNSFVLKMALERISDRIRALNMFKRLADENTAFHGLKVQVIHFNRAMIAFIEDDRRERPVIVVTAFNESESVMGHAIYQAMYERLKQPSEELVDQAALLKLYRSFDGYDARPFEDWLFDFISGTSDQGPEVMRQVIEFE